MSDEKPQTINNPTPTSHSNHIAPIKTTRLVLREFTPADTLAYFSLESLESVTRYQTWPPLTHDQATSHVANIVRAATTIPRTQFELAVIYQDTFIGRVGARVLRDASPRPHADLWFSFLPEYQGRGFATEAMQAFLPVLGGGPLELEIECDPRNRGSWRVAERLGFERVSLVERAFECKGELVGSLVSRRWVE